MTSATAKTFNPFYPLIVISGALFCVTAIGYAVSLSIAMQPPGSEIPEQSLRFIGFYNDHGNVLLLGEALGIIVSSIAAMTLDRFFSRSSPAAATVEAPLPNIAGPAVGERQDERSRD